MTAPTDSAEATFDRDRLRSELDATYQTLQARLKALNRDVQRKGGPRQADFAEQATEAENDEVLDRLIEQTRAEMHQLQAAIARMSDPDFGLCAACDDPIGVGRLKAVPHTTLCIACAEARDA